MAVILYGALARTLLAAGLLSIVALSGSARAQQAPPLFTSGPASVWLSLEAGTQIVGQRNAFWNLTGVLTPAQPYGLSRHWYEAYAKPGARVRYDASAALAFYGGASALASYTLRHDVFLTGDTGRILPEEAYVGVKYAPEHAGLTLDLSAGSQEYRIGSGMLIASGGGNGFERGAVIFGPRRAWSMAGLARATLGAVSLDGFYLDPNELASSDTKTRLAGAKLEYTLGKDQHVGVSAFKAINSETPYIQAAAGGVGVPAIIMGGRDGLETLYAYGRFIPLPQNFPGFWISADAAFQRNERLDMKAWGGRLEAGVAFAHLPWAPTVSWAYQMFSGDDPDTRALERFDPLYYDGSPGGWVSGSNGSLVFINSNINVHKITLRVTPTPRDILTLRYMHVRADELKSPIQFGQATRVTQTVGTPIIETGVTKSHLSDDILAEYTRVLTPNAYLSFGVAYSAPGPGLRSLVPSSKLPGWPGAFANLVVRY